MTQRLVVRVRSFLLVGCLGLPAHAQCIYRPAPVTPPLFESFCDDLDLNESQMLIARSFFDGYRSAYDTMAADNTRRYIELREKKQNPALTPEEAARVQGRMSDVHFEGADEANRLIRDLVTETSSLLREDQLSALENAEQRLRRAVHDSRHDDVGTFTSDLLVPIT